MRTNGSPSPMQGEHIPLEPKALENGTTILRAAMDFGFVGPLDISSSHFHPELQSVARIIRNARDGGAKDFSDIILHLIQTTEPGQAQDVARGKVAEIGGGMLFRPEGLTLSAEIVRNYHRARNRQLLIWELNTPEGQEPVRLAEILKQLADIEAGNSPKSNLRERAYALRFNADETPPPDETCMVIGDVPIAARGNLTVPQGKSKVGKSALISAILGAAHRGNLSATGDTLCVAWQGESKGAIVHLDTEQSRADWHSLVRRGITRSGLTDASPRLVSLPLVMFSRSERLGILRQTLEFERSEKGTVDAVIIDGVADLCVSPNDEAEALELVSQLHALAQEFHCPVFCVLHENPGSDQGKTRGHLGSELNRKAFANLRIDKDAETSISTIYGSDMRKRDIPKEQGFCFGWDEAAGMHTFKGRAAGLKAAQKDEKAATEAREYWEPIFEHLAGNRENIAFPAITANLAVISAREISGNGEATKIETMKKRLQKAETLGVLRKSSPGEWVYVPSGKSGKEREK